MGLVVASPNLPHPRQFGLKRGRKLMRHTDHLFYFCKPSEHQPETLFNEEFCQVSKDLLSKDIQIGTPNPEVFQFLVFDRGSLLARL
jgi:hypothetical protein